MRGEVALQTAARHIRVLILIFASGADVSQAAAVMQHFELEVTTAGNAGSDGRTAPAG